MTADRWPLMVRDLVELGRGGAPLLAEFERHVGWMARPYPDAYFVLGRKSPEAVTDLSHRSFTTCARVPKGRFPFRGREPFRAFVEEDFDGRAIRYHSIYAKLSITREILREDYARNLVRDPRLRWRAEVYARVGEILRAHAEPLPGSGGRPPRWRIPGGGPVALVQPELVESRLRASGQREIEPLVLAALGELGQASRSQLANMVADVIGEPAPAVDPAFDGGWDPGRELDVRRVVAAAWEDLDEDGRRLLGALARGRSYDEIVEAEPRFRNKVAVFRAVDRLARGFVERIERELGLEASPVRPRELVECVLGVILEIDSEVADEPRRV